MRTNIYATFLSARRGSKYLSKPSLRGIQPFLGWTTWQSHWAKFFKEKD